MEGIRIGYKFDVTATKRDDHYTHFGIRKSMAHIWGDKPEDVVKLELEVIAVGVDNHKDSDPSPDYWGYWNNEKEDLSMIWPSFVQFSVCFPYSLKAYEEKGDGWAVRLKVNKEI